MNVSFPCATKTALLSAYQDAAALYAGAVGNLAQEIGAISRDEYSSLRVASQRARRVSEEALETLDAHSDEHGC